MADSLESTVVDVSHFYLGVDRPELKIPTLVDLVTTLRGERVAISIAVCCWRVLRRAPCAGSPH